jgi:hypothetical protein
VASSKLPGWLVALNILFALLFLFSAALQYNDPDPLRWVAIYAGAAISTVLALHWRPGWLAAGAVGVVAAVWGGWLWHEVIGHVLFSDFWRKMSEKGGRVEVMREAGGLTIVCTWLSVSSLVGWQRSRPPKPAPSAVSGS